MEFSSAKIPYRIIRGEKCWNSWSIVSVAWREVNAIGKSMTRTAYFPSIHPLCSPAFLFKLHCLGRECVTGLACAFLRALGEMSTVIEGFG